MDYRRSTLSTIRLFLLLSLATLPARVANQDTATDTQTDQNADSNTDSTATDTGSTDTTTTTTDTEAAQSVTVANRRGPAD